MSRRKSSSGLRRVNALPNLIVCIDIGTTFTAASVCLHGPGSEPKIEIITSWPKQSLPSVKLPSVLFYDANGIAQAVGAECDDPAVLVTAEEENWHKVEWWKLLLRPDYLPPVVGLDQELPNILDITIEDIFKDFLEYIKDGLRRHFLDGYAQGAKLWDELSPEMTLILTTPNGREGKSQNRMRLAAVSSELVRRESQVRFVTEAEAAIIYTLESGRLQGWLQKGELIAMCDCGGGTIDITPYKVLQANPLQLEEIAGPQCLVAGSVFVDRQAFDWLTDHLDGSCFEVTPDIMKNFERHTKQSFDGKTDAWLSLGGRKSHKRLGILNGRLRIPINIMKEFFEPSIDAIMEGLEDVIDIKDHPVRKIVFGGGFANSPYLFQQVREWANDQGVEVVQPQNPLDKAVAHGGILWYLKSMPIVKRIKRFAYGLDASTDFNPNDPRMANRAPCMDAAGKMKVYNFFRILVEKGAAVRHSEVHSFWFHCSFSDDDDLDLEFDLWAYRWDRPQAFIRDSGAKLTDHYDGFFHVAKIHADLSGLYKAQEYRVNEEGKRFKYLQYQVCVCFGDTEIQAHLRWSDPKKKRAVQSAIAIGYD